MNGESNSCIRLCFLVIYEIRTSTVSFISIGIGKQTGHYRFHEVFIDEAHEHSMLPISIWLWLRVDIVSVGNIFDLHAVTAQTQRLFSCFFWFAFFSHPYICGSYIRSISFMKPNPKEYWIFIYKLVRCESDVRRHLIRY